MCEIVWAFVIQFKKKGDLDLFASVTVQAYMAATKIIVTLAALPSNVVFKTDLWREPIGAGLPVGYLQVCCGTKIQTWIRGNLVLKGIWTCRSNYLQVFPQVYLQVTCVDLDPRSALYLTGSPHEIIVHTDHANLMYWHQPHKISRRIARQVLELEEYNIKLQHVPGKIMDAPMHSPEDQTMIK